MTRKNTDLAVGDLAGRPCILAIDAARGLALLEKTCLIDHQHGIVVGQVLDHIIAHDIPQRVSVPTAAPQDGLLAPGARIASRLRPHPSGLSLLGSQKAVQEQPCRRRHTLLREQRLHPRLHVPQRRGP